MMKFELIQKLRDYLSEVITLQEFELWLLARLQDYFDSGDSQLARMAGDLGAMTAELKEGLILEGAFRQHAFELVSPKGQLLNQTTSNAGNSTIAKKEEFRGARWVSEDLVSAVANK